MSYFNKRSAQCQDYVVRSERLLIPFAIVHHATPASKTHSSDLSPNLELDLEGQLAASVIDTGCAFTTPNDGNGVFGVLIYGLGTVEKLLKVEMIDLSTGTVALTRVGASSTGVTASGNIAVSADWNGSLASTDLTATVAIDYRIRKA